MGFFIFKVNGPLGLPDYTAWSDVDILIHHGMLTYEHRASQGVRETMRGKDLIVNDVREK